MPTTAETFSVRLPRELKNEVDTLAKLTKRSRSYVVKEAVSVYMQDHREYLEAIDAALEDTKSGVGHSGEQIFRWMRAWGTGHEYALPKPDIRKRKSSA